MPEEGKDARKKRTIIDLSASLERQADSLKEDFEGKRWSVFLSVLKSHALKVGRVFVEFEKCCPSEVGSKMSIVRKKKR